MENRLAVDFSQLDLPIAEEEARELLVRHGIESSVLDIVDIARSKIGKTIYKRGAKSGEWPEAMDCSGFSKWLYGQLGIWLPRHSIDQRDSGEDISVSKLQAGDLVFTDGWRNYYWNDQNDGVGHVGIATSTNSVIHAANSKRNLVEDYLEEFMNNKEARGITRIADLPNTVTLVMKTDDIMESSTAVRWRILQHLK